jgi:hypothetical protein
MEKLALTITRKTIAGITVSLILISLLVGLQAVEVAKANPVPYDSSGESNVEVSIISPQNKTYDTNNIELIANFGAFPGVWYISYSLDGGSYIEIAPGHPLSHNLTETLSLSQLPKGSHSIEVKATAMANDEDGTVIACSKVNFTITKTLEPLPSSSPTPTPIEVGGNHSSILSNSVLIIAVIVAVGICLVLGFLLKRNHELKR